MTECGNCGRHNQPTTRFCAECGDVLRTDPPRKHRSRSKKRGRRLRPRLHWVRVPLREAPSIMTAKRVTTPPLIADRGASDRMVRRIDLLFALLVCIVGFGAYLGFPYLKRSGSEMTQTTPAPTAARVPASLAQVPIAPLPPSSPPARDVDAPTSGESALKPLPSSPKFDVVPPRTPTARAKPDASARRPAEGTQPAPPRPSYAVTTAFDNESFGSQSASASARAVAPQPRAPVRVDPLQKMNDAFAACAGEGLFARIACEQRALLAYCDGRWGQNERCPSGRTTDYGN
jgi:hypothetical protein